MALYHVSLMKGKKNDGTRIKAVEHVKYINSEEKYADADREPDNLIRSRREGIRSWMARRSISTRVGSGRS